MVEIGEFSCSPDSKGRVVEEEKLLEIPRVTPSPGLIIRFDEGRADSDEVGDGRSTFAKPLKLI